MRSPRPHTGAVIALTLFISPLALASPSAEAPLASAPAATPASSAAPTPTLEPTLDPASESLRRIEADPDYVDVTQVAAVTIDLRYGSENNFLGRNLYGSFQRCFLHRRAAEKLKRATEILAAAKPDFKFKVFDCLRPRSVQKLLWAAVVQTPKQKYVADPASGSIHNFGFALDLTVTDATGKELDMGTSYDSFSPLSEPALEEMFAKERKLTAEQLANRKILRAAMTQAGFEQLASEWWHFDALPKNEVRKSFKIIE